MARSKEAPQPPIIKEVFPPDLSPAKRLQLLTEIQTKQTEYARGTANKHKISIELPRKDPNRPFRIVTLSDLHLGHRAVDLNYVKELMTEILSDPDVYVILTGDEIEGYSPKHFNTSLGETTMNLRAQIDFFKLLILLPLLMRGKILTMVGTYWGHAEWHADDTTLNMQEILAAVDMQDVLGLALGEMTVGAAYAQAQRIQQGIPIIENGGILEVSVAGQEPITIEVLHNPKGRNKVDPVHGVRENTMQLLQAGEAPDAAVAGHIHNVGTADEVVDQQTRIVLVQAGTAKSIPGSGVKDLYGVKGTFGASGILDQSILVIPTRQPGQKPLLAPMINRSRANLLYDSLTTRDAIAAAGNDQELYDLIHAHEPQPVLTINEPSSKQKTSEEERKFTGVLGADKKYVQPYERLVYDVETKLPLLLYPIGNSRVGSAAEDEDTFYSFFDSAIANNPHALYLLLRNLVDAELGRDQNRKSHLDALAQHILPTRSQGLGLLASETLRKAAWKKSLGQEEHLQPIAPATYLSEILALPLLSQFSLVGLKINGDNPYNILTIDRPMQFTASGKPTRGLMTINHRMLGKVRPDAIVSASNTHQVGIASIPSPRGTVDFIASGHTATEVSDGPSKYMAPAASIGQGLIISHDPHTERYTTIPTLTAKESEDFFAAVLLYKGAELLGLTEKMKRKKRKSK
ncbi:hypothetical protein KA078_02385 [Candidatus Woesebacteria bacterium]|nr:hypothetical protein [Candidatus Woesebacteria bacterium]